MLQATAKKYPGGMYGNFKLLVAFTKFPPTTLKMNNKIRTV